MSKKSSSIPLNKPQSFYSLKFNFSSLKKYITMDLHVKATIDDLKGSFSNLLQTNLFAKKLTYFFSDERLETGKTMQDLIDEKSIVFTSLDPVQLEVRIDEEGA